MQTICGRFYSLITVSSFIIIMLIRHYYFPVRLFLRGKNGSDKYPLPFVMQAIHQNTFKWISVLWSFSKPSSVSAMSWSDGPTLSLKEPRGTRTQGRPTGLAGLPEAASVSWRLCKPEFLFSLCKTFEKGESASLLSYDHVDKRR